MTHIPSQYLQRFETGILPGLNEHQRAAVDLIEGPVMVIAGPGTGKTQLLAARIGNILRLTDTDPREILCLTYTEAGTMAMRRRLIDFLGPEGHRVPVHTFHGFCNLVIQENPAVFGGYRDLQPLTELEKRRLLKELINGLEPDHPLRRLRGDYYYNVPRLAALFDLMKREGFSPELVQDAIDRYLEGLPIRDGYFYKRKYKEFQPGDPRQAEIDKETARMEETRVAAALLPRWQEALATAGRYDFSDMLRWVRDAFAAETDLLRVYQERFLYILVDEYQDTSGLQNGILYQLADFWEQPNLFVVGDDDQAIYRFQGASMSNILEFQRRYDPLAIMLTDNYRSSQRLLDAADALIRHNQERLNTALGLEKRLSARNEGVPQPGQPPRLLEFHSSTGEETWIAGQIRSLLDQGVPPTDIAVLYRNHRHAENLIRLCRRRGVAVSQQRQEDILQDPFILGLLEVLHYLAGEWRQPFSEEARLLRILHYRYFGIKPLDLARLLRYMQTLRQQEGERLPRWRELLGKEEHLRKAGLDDLRRVQRVGEDLEYWLAHAPEWTIQTLFEHVLTRGGVLQAILEDPQKRRLLELVTTLFDHIKSECAAEPTLRLEELLARLDEMIEGKIALPYVHYIGEPDGVVFSTVHSAKGLEWNHVFLMACSAKHWSGRSGGKDFKLPDTLTRSDTANDEQMVEEERRLFFVAMTRARVSLHISYARDQKNASNRKTSSQDLAARFMNELLDSAGLALETLEPAPTDREETLEALLHPLDENPSLLEEAWLRRQVEQLSLSVTALNKYLSCPRAFYYENILRVPSARNRHMGYGSAVHAALENLFRRNPQLEGDVPAQTVDLFSAALQRFRSHFTDQEYVNTLEHGRKSLPLYVTGTLPRWRSAQKVELEVAVRDVEWQGFPINGKLDKIEHYPEGIMVVDYKTGNPANGKAKLKGPDPDDWRKDPGGDYWRQMVFYDLLLRSDRRQQGPLLAGVMEFVEPDAQGRIIREEVTASEEDRAIVSEQIAYAMEGIRELRFQQGCHDPACVWCQLVDHHILSESLSSGEVVDREDED
jgi:DNA helicase II / ATP-dependent DNA helicase PcrA